MTIAAGRTGIPQTARTGPRTVVDPRLMATLYASQYIGIGFLYFGIGGILRREGVQLDQIAAVQLLGLIWVVKALWAPLVDRTGPAARGHYRGWLLWTQPLMAVALLALAPFERPADDLGSVLLVFAAFIGISATQDIATDGLVARHVPAGEQGTAQAIASSAQWAGNLIGGGLLLVVYDVFGWTAALILLAVASLLPYPWVLALREPATGAARPRESLRTHYARLGTALTGRGRRAWVFAAMPLYWGGGTALYGLLSAALADAGWTLSAVAALLGVATAVPAILGAALTGRLLDRWPLARVMGLAGVAAAASGFALLPATGAGAPAWLVTAGVCVYVLAMSAVSTTVYRADVALVRDGSEGTDFTALVSAGTLWTAVVGYLVFTVAHYAGYAGAVLACAALTAVGTVLAVRQWRGHPAATSPAALSTVVLEESTHV